MKRILAVVFVLSCASIWGQTKLLRFPDVSGDQVVFSYGGDIWKASTSGGTATRMTAHPGQELFAKFSPDGRWIAFTGQYDGDEQVYVMPSQGGMPKQLTYYPAHGPLPPRWGYDNQVYGWTPDGTRVLFRSLRDEDAIRTLTALYTVSVDGGLPEMLPMPTSGAGDFSPDGRRLIYSPLFRDFRSWKRYQGGWAQDLYIFNLADDATTPIAHSVRTERDPMWIGDRIYFVSDRDGTLNLYSCDLSGGDIEELTHQKTWDVRWASSDNTGQIVYELDGEIHLYRISDKSDRKLDIVVPNDGIAMRPSYYSAARNIEDIELSPKGERALFVARGDVFTVPIEKGSTRNLTDSSNAHDKHARWSPDGSKIAFISDRSGEEQLYLINQDGSGEPEQLTTRFTGMLFAPEWSPDSKKLAFSDKDGKLYVLTISDRTVEQVADDEYGGIQDYAWSPDSAWLAFSMGAASDFRSLYIWSNADGSVQRVSDPLFNEWGPSWGPKGDYLYFLSDREFAPQVSTIEWNFATSRMTGIFAYALRKDVENLFPPQSDEVKVAEPKEPKSDEVSESQPTKPEGAEKAEAASPEEKAATKGIDFEGLAKRVVRIPVDFDNIQGITATDKYVLYLTTGAFYYGRRPEEQPTLKIFDLGERSDSVLVGGISSVAVSQDGNKVLVREGRAYKLYDVKPQSHSVKTVSTNGLMVHRVPAEEWSEIFDEVWRRYRDYFYVRNMHGYDWKAIGDRYRKLLPYVAHRSDLNYVLSEMVAELNIGHAYIAGGDFEIPDRPRVALPGARFELDKESNRYRISKIFQGQNEEPKYRSPLTAVGIDIQVGDYVLAIDGVDLEGTDNPYRLLQHKTDPVKLTVNSTPSSEGARVVEYTPISSEESLLYLDIVERNRKKVDEMTDGRVAYLHIPDMGASGIYEFIKWYYPQIRKEGLVVDVRSNGGGNVSQWIIERLDTKLLGTRFGYASDHPRTYPYSVFYGPMVCLIDQTSASDGDIFPYRFREAGLGPLIGKRTWGGVVGISGRGPLLDGGTVFVPMQGTNDVDGRWIIEGKGVTPDIEVENDPASVIAGRDPQLERGVQEVLRRMQEHPMKLPSRPADPVKTQ